MTIATEFVENPPSQEIADSLNRSCADVCKHGRRPCYTFCGVWQGGNFKRGVWQPIPQERRAEWFGHILGLWFRDNEREYDNLQNSKQCAKANV